MCKAWPLLWPGKPLQAYVIYIAAPGQNRPAQASQHESDKSDLACGRRLTAEPQGYRYLRVMAYRAAAGSMTKPALPASQPSTGCTTLTSGRRVMMLPITTGTSAPPSLLCMPVSLNIRTSLHYLCIAQEFRHASIRGKLFWLSYCRAWFSCALALTTLPSTGARLKCFAMPFASASCLASDALVAPLSQAVNVW